MLGGQGGLGTRAALAGSRVPYLGCKDGAGGAAVLGMGGGGVRGCVVPRGSRLRGPHAGGFDGQPCPFCLSSPCRGCLHKPGPPAGALTAPQDPLP